MTEAFRRDAVGLPKDPESFANEIGLQGVPETLTEYSGPEKSLAPLSKIEKPDRIVATAISSERKRPMSDGRISTGVSGPQRECSECGKAYRREGRNQKQCSECTTTAWVTERSEQYRTLVAMLWHG